MSLCVIANACKRQDVTIYRHDIMSLCVIANTCKWQDVFMCNIKLLIIIINQTQTNQIWIIIIYSLKIMPNTTDN